TLRRFALGRLDHKTMARIEGHLRGCPSCRQVAEQAPDDRLVASLRRPTTDSFDRRTRRLVVLGVLLSLGGSGCFGWSEPAVAPQKAKAYMSKRFASGDDKANPASAGTRQGR